MRLLYGITSSNWGGAQEYVFQLVKFEASKGNEVAVFVGEEGELTKRLASLNQVKVFIIPEIGRAINPIKDVKAMVALRNVYKQFQPDIIHLNSSKAGAVGRLATIGSNGRYNVTYTAHGWAFTDGVNNIKAMIYRTVEKQLVSLTDLILCVSKYDYDLANNTNLFHKKNIAKVIYNGSNFKSNDIIKSKKNKRVELLMVARFDKQKNQKLLIDAIKDLSMDYTLNFVGDGPTLKECEKLVHEYKLDDKVIFHGFQRDIRGFLETSDIFCLITNYEGLPISIIEAMAMKLPIIASNVGGNKELVSKENGFLVENDATDIAIAIKKLVEDRNLQIALGQKSYKKYELNFTLKQMLNLIHNEYLKLSEENDEI